MSDRSNDHPWGTCDGCGVDLGGVCCTEPHQFGDYHSLCGECFAAMKKEAQSRSLQSPKPSK